MLLINQRVGNRIIIVHEKPAVMNFYNPLKEAIGGTGDYPKKKR